MSRLIGTVLLVVVLLAGLALASANDMPVAIDFFFGRVELTLSQALALALAVGTVLGVGVSLPILLRARFDLARLRRVLRHRGDNTHAAARDAH